MLLLSGPPGAGKSRRILDQVRKALRRGAADFRLLVPTATMAEHLRHEFAREGFLVRPGLIQTLSKFVSSWVADWSEVSAAQLQILVGEMLDRATPKEFQSVAGLPGFRAYLAALIDEFATAGCDPQRLAAVLLSHGDRLPLGAAFQDVYARVAEELSRRCACLRAGLLLHAAENIRDRGLAGIRQVFLEGFYSFTDPELELICALRRHADLTVTLPLWRGANAARTALLAMGLPEMQLPGESPAAGKTLVVAPGIEQEAEEIARRILAHVEAGGAFRDIGIVVRGEQPYVPLLRTTLARFGIPARFYFAPALADHSIVRYFRAIVEAFLQGWDHEMTLEAVRMNASGVSAGARDRFDFAVRERLPGRGLAELRRLTTNATLLAQLDRFSQLDAWRKSAALPSDWAARLKSLRDFVRPPCITDGVDHDTAAVWRAQAAALDAFEAAVDETAQALPPGQLISFEEFWRAAALVLRETRLRAPDHRRNVVHVMDVQEARQWELPVVFLCGLLERRFPRYYSQDLVFPDSQRAFLQRIGIRIPTAADRQLEEEFLFQLAITRAGSELVLSYPESNERGEPNLPSFFLTELGLTPVKAVPVCPPVNKKSDRSILNLSAAPVPFTKPGRIESEDLLAIIRATHAWLRPTAIEDFLQCPFQFFAKHTLRLTEPPPASEDRLDAALRGEIVHKVLAEWHHRREPLEPLFDRLFDEACLEHGVIRGCAAELARLSMQRDLRRFLDNPLLEAGWSVFTEQPVEFLLGEGVGITGRIDRYDLGPSQAAVVFDFKYTSAAGVRERVKGYEEGKCVQGGLYLLALESALGARPAGLFYCALRGDMHLDGWHANLPRFHGVGTSSTPEVLRELLDRTRAVALEAARAIWDGDIASRENDHCERCSFRDLCRVAPAATGAQAAGGAG